MARAIFPFDEINSFSTVVLPKHFDERGRIKSKKDCEDIIDEMLDLFLLAYENGVDIVNEQFGGSYEPTLEEVERTVYHRINDLTWVDRVWEWYEKGGTAEDIVRIVETEAHRDGNAAADTTALNNGATKKTYITMQDEKVRDTHAYLDGVSVGVTDKFYTFDGDSAYYPGGFALPENNVNCRCELRYSQENTE